MVKLRRPILVGGIVLSFGLWLAQSAYDSVMEIGEYTLWGAIAFGTGFWFLQQRRSQNQESLPRSTPVDLAAVENTIAFTETIITQLDQEPEAQDASARLREQVAQLKTELERNEITIAVTGDKGVGKTALINALETLYSNSQPWPDLSVQFQETPGLFTVKDSGIEAETTAMDIALASDLVLFVTAGDLTDSELQALQQLSAPHQRSILVLNKQDQYLSTQRATVLQTLRQRVVGRLDPEDVVAIASNPAPVKVRQHQPDASVKEWLEPQTPDLTLLNDRLTQILTQEQQQLVWASTIRAMTRVQAQAKQELNHLRRDRALPIIEQYQWIAAAAAFANPVPALDLLATAAISAQLVTELGDIYQQKFSLSQAQEAAKTLGSLMVKLGLVELSTQAIGNMLKSHALTYVAGGAVQGVSAAYLTRLAGLSLIEYFQEQEQSETSANPQQFNPEQLTQKLKQVFQQNQRAAFMQGFVKQAVAHLIPKSSQPQPLLSKPSAVSGQPSAVSFP
ncbi:DUF697 domain-containing protein [Moorena sp. SIO3F7]|uniref:YcjF family protein n=1 Tax=unclassified Moorena TaxID=2683338 RepID=UPI00344EE795